MVAFCCWCLWLSQWRAYLGAIFCSKYGKCIVCCGGSVLGYFGWSPFVTTVQPSFFDASFSVSLLLSHLPPSVVAIFIGMDVTLLAVPGAEAYFSVRTKSALASSIRIALSDALLHL